MGEPLSAASLAKLGELVVQGKGVRGAARGLGLNWATVGRAYRGEPVSDATRVAIESALETAEGDVAARGRRARWTGAEVESAPGTGRGELLADGVELAPALGGVELGPGRRDAVLSLPARACVEVMSPGWGSGHLGRVWDVWEAAEAGEAVRAVVAAPPRGGKSEGACHFIASALIRNPAKRFVYVSYAQKLTDMFARRIRGLYLEYGGKIRDDHNRIDNWKTPEGGGLVSTGIEGMITGVGADVIVCDDLVQGRAEADSKLVRDSTFTWFSDTLYPRLEPGGSIVVMMTRWDIDDVSGRLLDGQMAKCKRWESVVIPAIGFDDMGREASYWPERWPLEELAAIRGPDGGDNAWWSNYQGRPREDGARLFGAARWGTFPGDELPVAVAV